MLNQSIWASQSLVANLINLTFSLLNNNIIIAILHYTDIINFMLWVLFNDCYFSSKNPTVI